MIQLYSVPRINALGLTGPELSSKSILKNKEYKLIPTENQDIQKDQEQIYEEAKKAYTTPQTPFFIGGDHSITYPLAKAFLEKNGKENSFLIILDAHADCMPPMPEPTHEEVFAGLVKAGWEPGNIAIIGLRKVEQVEKEYMDKEGIKYVYAGANLVETLDKIQVLTKEKQCYLSIDIDVLKSEIAPGVSYQEKGGLTLEEVSYIIGRVVKETNIKAIDLVEIVEKNDKGNKTVEIARELVDYIIELSNK
ncbi:MAG: agmatinase [Patescibacteria group bacterium]|jgi:agmatinase